MTELFFACTNCRINEIKRVKGIDDEINKDKKFFNKKQNTKLNPENFIREASKIVFLKNTQLEYSTIHETQVSQNDIREYESSVSQDDGWKFTCSFCDAETRFERGFGNL